MLVVTERNLKVPFSQLLLCYLHQLYCNLESPNHAAVCKQFEGYTTEQPLSSVSGNGTVHVAGRSVGEQLHCVCLIPLKEGAPTSRS